MNVSELIQVIFKLNQLLPNKLIIEQRESKNPIMSRIIPVSDAQRAAESAVIQQNTVPLYRLHTTEARQHVGHIRIHKYIYREKQRREQQQQQCVSNDAISIRRSESSALCMY